MKELFIKNICNQSQIKKINDWISDYKKSIYKPLFITGNNGNGKSTLATLILKKYNYSIVKLNKLYIDNPKNINEILDKILKNKSISMMFSSNIENKGLIIDDFDHYYNYEKSIYNDILKLIKNINKYPNNPLIIISNKLGKKLSSYMNKECTTINIKYTKNKLEVITNLYLLDYSINMSVNDTKQLIKSCNNNLTNIIEKMKFISERNKIQENNLKDKNQSNNSNNFNNIIFDNNEFYDDNISYMNYLFNLEINKKSIDDIFININNDINIIILTLLENAIKYIHNSSNKKYKSSINTICNLYDNITLSDYYEYYNITNNEYNNNFIIVHGILYPVYFISQNMKKSQYIFKETSIYSKSIIEIHNNKQKVAIESISNNIKNIDNIIKIIYNNENYKDNLEIKKIIHKYLRDFLKNDNIVYKDIFKYIKYIMSKCYGMKLKDNYFK